MSCVNSVGVDLNTASPALLEHVAGLTGTLARSQWGGGGSRESKGNHVMLLQGHHGKT